MPERTERIEEDAYTVIQEWLDAALGANDPEVADAGCRRVQLLLARVATSPDFDARRSRAIATALRDRARSGRPGPAPVTPLTTR